MKDSPTYRLSDAPLSTPRSFLLLHSRNFTPAAVQSEKPHVCRLLALPDFLSRDFPRIQFPPGTIAASCSNLFASSLWKFSHSETYFDLQANRSTRENLNPPFAANEPPAPRNNSRVDLRRENPLPYPRPAFFPTSKCFFQLPEEDLDERL